MTQSRLNGRPVSGSGRHGLNGKHEAPPDVKDGVAFSAAEKRLLQRPLEPLELRGDAITAAFHADHPQEFLKEVCGQNYESNFERQQILSVAKAGSRILKRRLEALGIEVQQLTERVQATPQYTMVISASRKSSSELVKWIKVVLVVIPAILMALAVYAEQSISIYMAQNAGLGFEDNKLLAFCFVFVLAALPGICLKGVQYYLPNKLRRRFSMGLNIVGTALSVVIVVCFTKVVGDAMHGATGAFGEAGHSSAVYLQALLAMEIAGLAIILTVMLDFLQVFFRQFVTQRPRVEPERIFGEQFLENREALLDGLIKELSLAEMAIRSWHVGRADYINRHQVAFTTLQSSIRRKQSQLLEETLTAPVPQLRNQGTVR